MNKNKSVVIIETNLGVLMCPDEMEERKMLPNLDVNVVMNEK